MASQPSRQARSTTFNSPRFHHCTSKYFYPDNIDFTNFTRIIPPPSSDAIFGARGVQMSVSTQTRCTAFEGSRRIGSGDLAQVAMEAKDAVDRGGQVLIFDDVTSQPIELDLRGTADDVRTRLTAAAGGPARRLPNRPDRPHAVRAGRSLVLSPARSRCCRVIGTGSTRSPAVHRSRCASWSSKRGTRARAKTASGNRRRRPTGSWSRWRVTVRASRRRREPCSQATAIASTGRSPPGRLTCGTTRAGSPPSPCGASRPDALRTSISSNRDRR